MMTEAYDAVVLAGGRADRLGGADKPALTVGGRSLLDRVIAGAGGARRTVVVGPHRPTARPVRWVRERPPGGGPVAALAAGLPEVRAPQLVVLAADLPFAASAVPRLLSALARSSRYDGAVLVDADGRDQPLLAAYRANAIRSALRGVGEPPGCSVRRLLADLQLARVPAEGAEALDCDTADDVHRARRYERLQDAAPGDAGGARRDDQGNEEATIAR
jgi:molybdopterin-guanine dinucleotide biosynthesis protein A